MHLTRCKIDLYDCLYLYTIKTAVDWCRNGQSSKLAISDRRSGSDPQILGDLFCHYCTAFFRTKIVGAGVVGTGVGAGAGAGAGACDGPGD